MRSGNLLSDSSYTAPQDDYPELFFWLLW